MGTYLSFYYSSFHAGGDWRPAALQGQIVKTVGVEYRLLQRAGC